VVSKTDTGSIGSSFALLDALGARLLARNFPFRVGFNASALFIGFREASLSPRDYLAVWKACLVLPAFAVGHSDYMASARLMHESCALRFRAAHWELVDAKCIPRRGRE
jgi:hypothetical protein